MTTDPTRHARALLWLTTMHLCVACLSESAEPDGGNGGSGGVVSGGGDEGGQQASPCGETADPPAFAIGTGEVCYEALRDGDIVTRLLGVQNGFHIWTAIVCSECPEEIILTVGLKLEGSDDWVAPANELVVTLKSAQVAGIQTNLPGDSFTPEAQLPEGTVVRMVVSARELDGTPLSSGEKLITLGPVEVYVNRCDPDPVTCGHPGGIKCCSA